MITVSIFLISTLLILSLFSLTCAFYHFLKPVETSKLDDKSLPFVSVIIPARNEEGKIERCIQSVLKQDYPNFEVVIINDRSTDRTGDIIAEFAAKDKRIKFVQGKEAPDGWIGKCNALANAVGYASGEFFIFTDADTYHHPNSVRDAISHAIVEKCDLLSFVPVQELGSFWERLVMPVLLGSFLLGDPFHTVNDPDAARAYAYGQYILCRRSSYHAIGGHQSVRDEIVEDHAIGRVFKEKGYKVNVADGKTLYSVRMYTDFESLWQGWTKNVYSLIDSKIFNLIFLVIMLNTILLLPYLELAWVVAEWYEGDLSGNLYKLTSLVITQWVIFSIWWRKTTTHHSGVDWRHFFLIPFGGIAVSCLHIHSAYLVLMGEQVKWKGRQYVVNKHKTIQTGALEKAKLRDASDG